MTQEERIHVLIVDERDAGIGDFESPIEDLDHRAGAGLKEILMDKGIGDKFANGDLRKHR